MKGKFLARLAMPVVASTALSLGVAGAAGAAPKAAPHAAGATLTSATITLDNLTSTSGGNDMNIQVIDVFGNVAAQAVVGFFGAGNTFTVRMKARANATWESLHGGAVRIGYDGNGTLTFGDDLELAFSDGDRASTAEDRVVLDPTHRSHTHPLEFPV